VFMCRKILSFAFICSCILIVSSSNLSLAQIKKNKTITLSGKIYRSDTNQPVPKMKIEIWNPLSSLETQTDEKGNYSFEQVKAGKYKVRISLRYNKISDVPCKIGTGATADKDSYVNMKDEGDGYIYVWVTIDNSRIYPGKAITKDFDVACKGFSRNKH
jgi:hypothetical protein